MLGAGLEKLLSVGPSSRVERLGKNEIDAGWGIIPRAVTDLFTRLSRRRNPSVFCSYMHIYQDKLFDLLDGT